MRIEDLDGPRLKPGADRLALTDLKWLGIDWDGEVLYQRHDLSPYHQALDQLRELGHTYPCTCSRKDIRLAQSAPHADDHELRYPGTCRPVPMPQAGTPDTARPVQDPDAAPAWRVMAPNEPITFTDGVCGLQTIDVQQQVGDFVVSTKAGLPAYQLAVVVDDARQGVTEVIRGDDLIRSTGRQLWLYRLLGLEPPQRYLHVPLVFGQDGRRLAKRHGDTRLATYRQQGVDPSRIVGLIAYWCGMGERPTPMTPDVFLDSFRLESLAKVPVMFTPEDHRWLLDQ